MLERCILANMSHLSTWITVINPQEAAKLPKGHRIYRRAISEFHLNCSTTRCWFVWPPPWLLWTWKLPSSIGKCCPLWPPQKRSRPASQLGAQRKPRTVVPPWFSIDKWPNFLVIFGVPPILGNLHPYMYIYILYVYMYICIYIYI